MRELLNTKPVSKVIQKNTVVNICYKNGIYFAAVLLIQLEMKRRILVIEDDDIVRDTVQLLLEYRGYEVLTSSNGQGICTIVKDFEPHLVLTDIYLGETDGRIICQELKNNPKTSHIPVVVMSGSSDIYNSISSFGANDIVSKPFDEQTLVSRLQRQLTA